MDIQLTMVFISLSVSLIVLFFIIWDHLKDDRLLAKEVQEFYEDIEMLIFSHIQVNYYDALQSNEEKMDKMELPSLKKNKNRDNIQNTYLKVKIRQKFPKYAHYLGLTFNEEKKIFLNGTIYILYETGILVKRNIELYTEENVIPSYTEIKKENILDILVYLNSLRFYWRKRYMKTFFRPKLVEIVNFYDLLGYTKPIEEKKVRKRFKFEKLSK